MCDCTRVEFPRLNDLYGGCLRLKTPLYGYKALPVHLRVPQLPRHGVEMCPELSSNLTVSERLDYQTGARKWNRTTDGCFAGS